MNTRTGTFDRRTLLRMAGAAGTLTVSPIAFPALAGAAPATPLATPQASSLDRAIGDTMAALSIPGANVTVVHGTEDARITSYGVSDLDTGAPMTAAMHVRIGSLTKTMTSTVVLQLIDEGKLGLEDSLSDSLPDQATFPDAERISIRDLLGMTSGVFDIVDDESFFGQILSDPTRAWTPDEMIAIAATHDPVFAPGADVAYSNTNYVFLGMIIERLTGQPAPAVLEQRLFAPLGMTNTSLPMDPALPTPYAQGYGFDPTGQSPDPVNMTQFNPTAAWTAGGVVSTAGDLLVWQRALLGGSTLSDALQQAPQQFQPIRPD
jgi:D-alanyl-D-alanine carboxypeptidase